MIDQQAKCPGCGSYSWEWGDEHEPVDAYEADGLHCPGCERIEVEQDRRRDTPDNPGVRIALYPKDR